MVTATPLVLVQATPAPGVGPDELLDYWPDLLRIGWFVVGFVVVVLVGWYVVVPALVRTVRRRNRDNPTIQEAVTRYLRVAVVFVAVFVGAGVAGYGQFLTNSALVIAAGTLALGVAGQTVIGSLISGLVLVLDPEFNVGDYIKWEGGEGTVQAITLRVTRIRTANGELVTIPNTVLTAQPITRSYGRGQYRVVEHVEISYEDDVDEAMRLLEAAAVDRDRILEEPAPSVYVDELGGDGVILRVHYWVQDPQRRDVLSVRSAYARSVKARLEAAGITISPASQRDLEGRIEVGKPDR